MKIEGRHWTCIALAALGLAQVGSVFAQASPYYVGVAQAFTNESNVFRVATGIPESSDTYSTTSLLAGINQPFGRQRFFTDAVVRYNRYRENTQLDNTGYGLAAGLDWETVERLSGRIGYTLNENLARFGADAGPPLTTKNMERSQEFVASGQYGRISLLSLEAAYTHRQLDYSAAEWAYLEYKQDAISLGVLYRPSEQLTLGAATRHTEGRYPFAVETTPGVFQEDKFTRNDFDLTADWVATGFSTVAVRLSFTRESHDVVTSRDINGPTGAVRWDYKPTGKLAFTTQFIHDSGPESSFTRYDQGGAKSIGSDSQISNSVLFRGLYEATAKVQIEFNARYERRNLVNSFELSTGGTSTETGSDELGEMRLGVNYAPTRSLLFGCALGYEKRATSSSLSYPYTAGIANCSAQFKLQ